MKLQRHIAAVFTSLVLGLNCTFTLAQPAVPPATAPAGPVIAVAADRAMPMYKAGEKAVFTIHVSEGGNPGAGRVACALTLDGFDKLSQQIMELVNGEARIEGTLKEPGILQLQAKYSQNGNDTTALAAAVFDADKIRCPDKVPADFAEFWDGQKKALAKVLLDAEVTLEPKLSTPDVQVFRVAIRSIDNTHVRGWLCRPAKEGKYPVMADSGSSGISATKPDTAIAWAKNGFIAMEVSAHDIPLDETPEYYQKLLAEGGAFYRLGQTGNDAPATYYFRGSILGLVRVVDYLVSRADWDGKHVILSGSSQGGGLILAAAGLDPRVNIVAAIEPAYCWWGRIIDSGRMRSVQGQTPEKIAAIRKTATYYDPVNFAPSIKADVFFGIGLIDTTCPPSGTFAAANMLPKPPTFFIVPNKGHRAGGATWWDALVDFLNTEVKSR